MLTLSVLPYALGAAGILAVAAWLYFRGRSSAVADQAQKRMDAIVVSKEIDDAVAGRTPGENRKELDQWKR